MEISLLLVVVGLFVAVLVLKSILSLAVRYALFVAVALLVFTDRYGPDVAAWLDGPRAVQVAVVAGTGLVGTKLLTWLFLRQSRWRFLATPVVGVALTALATRVIAG